MELDGMIPPNVTTTRLIGNDRFGQPYEEVVGDT